MMSITKQNVVFLQPEINFIHHSSLIRLQIIAQSN